MPKLRQAMQLILDDLQSDVQDELEKVSLERLASIDPDLLVKIKRTAEDSLRNGDGSKSGGTARPNSEPEDVLPFFLADTRSEAVIRRSKAWESIKIDSLKESHDILAGLRHLVMEVSKSDTTYTQMEAISMTNALGAAGAMATILTTTLERIRDDEKKAKSISSSEVGTKIRPSGGVTRGFFAIDKSLFTSDGLKKKNLAVVGMLYEIGLPFPSTTDGRRFATQLELSNHLDALFKKKYVLCRKRFTSSISSMIFLVVHSQVCFGIAFAVVNLRRRWQGLKNVGGTYRPRSGVVWVTKAMT